MLCDRPMPTRLKGEFYRRMISPAMTYGVECWLIKKQHIHKISVAEMRILRWVRCKTRKHRIRNEHFRKNLKIASIGDKIRKIHLKWFGHIQCRLATMPMRKTFSMQVHSPPRERSRTKRTWMEIVKLDIFRSATCLRFGPG